jgi:hypothetical protein
LIEHLETRRIAEPVTGCAAIIPYESYRPLFAIFIIIAATVLFTVPFVTTNTTFVLTAVLAVIPAIIAIIPAILTPSIRDNEVTFTEGDPLIC